MQYLVIPSNDVIIEYSLVSGHMLRTRAYKDHLIPDVPAIEERHLNKIHG